MRSIFITLPFTIVFNIIILVFFFAGSIPVEEAIKLILLVMVVACLLHIGIILSIKKGAE